jgi:hypothetical protein
MAPDDARETGFGTGLLAHLEARDPQEAEPPQPVVEPEPAAQPEDEAAERERRLIEREAALEAALRRLEEKEAALAGRADDLPPVPRRPVAAVLRERAEREGERLWRAFDAALDATFPDGRPDVRTRLEAAETLLAQLELADAVMPPDELALRRDLRLGRVPG